MKKTVFTILFVCLVTLCTKAQFKTDQTENPNLTVLRFRLTNQRDSTTLFGNVDEASKSSHTIKTSLLKLRNRRDDAAGNSESTWIGATLFYNLDGPGSAGNVVGAAKVTLETARLIKDPWNLNIVGNIAKITASTTPDDNTKAIGAIAQSDQGLFVGIEPVYKVVNQSDKFNFLDVYANLGYKLNDFQNVNNTTNNIALSQFRLALGIQYEGVPFDTDNDLLHFSIEGGINSFDSNKYQQVFNKKLASIATLESTVIIPIATRMGLMFNYTLAQQSSPIFGAGIVIKNLKQPSK